MKLIPASTALLIILDASCSDVGLAKLSVPRPMGEILTPVLPKIRYSRNNLFLTVYNLYYIFILYIMVSRPLKAPRAMYLNLNHKRRNPLQTPNRPS